MILTPHGEHSGPQGRGFKSHRCHVLLFVDFYRVSDASSREVSPVACACDCFCGVFGASARASVRVHGALGVPVLRCFNGVLCMGFD